MNVWDFLQQREDKCARRVSELRALIETSLAKLEIIMGTQAELAQQLLDAVAKGEKAKGEIVAKLGELQAAIVALQEELANAGGVSPELQAAADAVSAKAQELDDIVADAPPV